MKAPSLAEGLPGNAGLRLFTKKPRGVSPGFCQFTEGI